ncbi:MAG: PQQ-binding-like beta-propeller repeat protein, partial [Burkholderiales bacterium]|nr:PQQ-binding-like beta-propeller repeat protein [Burkholderiales bacterium]
MYIFTRLPLIAVFFVLTGCSSLSSLNPFSSKLDPKNAPAILEDFKPTLSVRKVWSVSVGSAGNYVFSPASDGRNLYSASSDGTLVKIDSVSGNVLWRINSGTRLTGGVGADSLTVAVAGDKGLLSAFDSDGKLRWKVQNSTEMLSAPVVGDGLVVARSIDNRVSAFDAQTGKRKWVVERPLPALTLRTVPGLVIENHQVLVALPGGHMISISTETGAVRWDSVVGEPKGA